MKNSLAVVVFTVSTSLACGGLDLSDDDWDGENTWSCGGSDHKTLRNLTVVVKEKDLVGISAGGSCELEIIDCDITADFPLKAAGNAKVTVKGGRITGHRQAVQAWGDAVITLEGTVVSGDVATTGNGKIIGP